MCPKCSESHVAKKFRLKNVTAQSNLRCTLCGEIECAKTWRCECEVPWIKCHRHIMNTDGLHKTRTGTRKRKASQVGLDNPLPARRSQPMWTAQIDVAMEARRTVGLTPGSKLAIRFPHLVKQPRQEVVAVRTASTSPAKVVEQGLFRPSPACHQRRDTARTASDTRNSEHTGRAHPYARKRVAFNLPPHAQRGGPIKGPVTEEANAL